jgi:hypothetical protein
MQSTDLYCRLHYDMIENFNTCEESNSIELPSTKSHPTNNKRGRPPKRKLLSGVHDNFKGSESGLDYFPHTKVPSKLFLLLQTNRKKYTGKKSAVKSIQRKSRVIPNSTLSMYMLLTRPNKVEHYLVANVFHISYRKQTNRIRKDRKCFVSEKSFTHKEKEGSCV